MDYDTGLPIKKLSEASIYMKWGRTNDKDKYAVDAATRRIRFKRKLKLNLCNWMFMSLAVGFYILFQGYPIICSIQYSLLDWSNDI